MKLVCLYKMENPINQKLMTLGRCRDNLKLWNGSNRRLNAQSDCGAIEGGGGGVGESQIHGLVEIR